MSAAHPAAGTVHVVGAGLAGLAAALTLSRSSRSVMLHEAAGHAGGRCRSFHDDRLGCRIDNGNHLLLSANRAALEYLEETGAAGTLVECEPAFPFLDLASGRRWTVRPNDGWLGRRLLAPLRQVPGARLGDLLRMLRLAIVGPRTTVMDALGPGPLMERFWRPLTVAVLNAEPEIAAASLLPLVLHDILGDGGACPLIARDGLSAAFVDPALATLSTRGVAVGFGRRLREVRHDAGRVVALDFPDGTIDLGPADAAVLAIPPAVAGTLLPDLRRPTQDAAIVNAHFRLDAPGRLPGDSPLIGLTGGTAQWIFVRDRIASVTVSAADALAKQPVGDLLAMLWRDTAAALDLPETPVPPGRIVKERRATFRQSPDQVALRPPARTRWRNLALAGDWTDTGLPATVEGAIRSGRLAAAVIADDAIR